MRIFGRKNDKGIKVFAPVAGRVRKMEDVPDPVFAKKMMGDGFAVEPLNGNFAAPVAGELVLLAETLHAFAVRTDEGLEVLVHIGIDTVKLKGNGFSSSKSAGDKVAVGDVVITVDLDVVGPQVPSMMTPVIITNGDDFTVTEPDLDADGVPVLVATKTSKK
ncbi:MAG: PTS glucose transporter subunit IIA [Propionibacteriaceae bacterium]|nr:PTS glucose transporter subunit IIA [Propionibacteriaceae bacterium]